jgi:uncharacterized integral membrane protein
MKTSKPTSSFELDTISIVFAAWICALPFVLLILLPIVGFAGALVSVFMLVIAMLEMCWNRSIADLRLSSRLRKLHKRS